MSRRFVALDFPEWLTWGQRSGASIDRSGWPRGPSGRPLCGWCKAELPKRRSSWCSNACSNAFGRVWSWGAVAGYVMQRDGTCQRCGSDRRLEVDHILPVVDGGTDDPENLRLLCHGCHVAVGYEQREARRLAQTGQTVLFGGAA